MNFFNEYMSAVRAYEKDIESLRPRFTVTDPNSMMYGTFASFNMLGDVGGDLGRIAIASTLYACEDSRYYHSKKMLDAIKDGCAALDKKIHPDGTVDMLETNFHTAEQFGLEHMSLCALNMKKNLADGDDDRKTFEILCGVIKRLLDGCLHGGFHTPNHRWVETAAILQGCAVLDFKDCESYMQKAQKYIAEKIDCDEYGEFSERSAGMYNRHCDHVFLGIYEQTKNRDFLDAVCRNLDLMTYYINNDFSMFTQNSRRKDKGEVGSQQMFYKATKYYADIYFSQYLLTAYLTGEDRYAAVAAEIVKNANAHGGRPRVDLEYFLEYPELKRKEFNTDIPALPKTYELYQPKSNIVRMKNDTATFSFLAKNPSFLQIEAAGMQVAVRMCSSFFAVAQFIPDKLEKTDSGYKMTMIAHGEYKLPLDDPGENTNDYWSIDYNARKAVQQQDLKMTATLDFCEDGAELGISVDGCENVPTKIEFAFNPGLLVEIGDAAMLTRAGANAFGKRGTARFESCEGAVLTLEDVFCKHIYAEGMRGSFSPIDGMFTFYMTDFAPFNRKVKIKITQAQGTRIFY